MTFRSFTHKRGDKSDRSPKQKKKSRHDRRRHADSESSEDEDYSSRGNAKPNDDGFYQCGFKSSRRDTTGLVYDVVDDDCLVTNIEKSSQAWVAGVETSDYMTRIANSSIFGWSKSEVEKELRYQNRKKEHFVVEFFRGQGSMDTPTLNRKGKDYLQTRHADDSDEDELPSPMLGQPQELLAEGLEGLINAGVPEVDLSKIPEAHKTKLRESPEFAPKFDSKYGEGTAARVLRGEGVVAAIDLSNVPPKHMEMLLETPSFAGDFDKKYGKGASAQVFAEIRGAGAGNPAMMTPQAAERKFATEQERKAEAIKNLAAQGSLMGGGMQGGMGMGGGMQMGMGGGMYGQQGGMAIMAPQQQIMQPQPVMQARPAGMFDGKMSGKIGAPVAAPSQAKVQTPEQKAFGS